MTKSHAQLVLPAGLLILAGLTGCSQKVIEITSEPSGALVTLNDVPVGRTPLQTEFTYYGDYDVQVRKDGFEPIRTKQTAWTPIYERPPLDLATAPIPYETVIRWHFKLEPTLESSQSKQQFEEGLVGRAKSVRDQLQSAEEKDAQDARNAKPPANQEDSLKASPGKPVETSPPPPPPA